MIAHPLLQHWIFLSTHAAAEAVEQGAEAAGHAAAHHGPAFWTPEWWISTNVINIILAALVIIWAVRKAQAHKIFHNQQAEVQSELDSLYAERDKAKASLAAIQQRTANLHQEVDDILANAKTAAEDLRAKILADAQAEAEAIAERSRERMVLEDRRLMRQMQDQMLSEAVLAAKEALNAMPESEKVRSVETFAELVAKS